MTTYEYQVLRYLPDRVGGEFVNVGLIIFQPQSHFLRASFLRSTGRVTNFFPGLDGRTLQRRLRHLEGMIESLANQFNIGLRYDPQVNIGIISGKFIVKDDTALQFSDVKKGIDDDLNIAFDDLYERLIENYTPEISETVKNDYEVWQKLYRPFFEKRGITNRLRAHKVNTANDTIDFQYAWKNEIWHCYQPVTFDLKKADSVKNKVYKWVGRFDELKTADEELEIQLLTALPDDDPELLAFVLEKLDQKVFGSTKVSVIRQQQAEEFATQVQEEIIEHEVK